jgi:ribonuclease BN (tRNA processing enzyme)
MRFLSNCILLFTLCGCAGGPSQYANKTHKINNGLDVTISTLPDNKQAELKIQYLGVGGFAFEVNDERLLTAPFFSNPPLLKNIPFRAIESNSKLIEIGFPEELKASNDSVKGILVGHSHYDHLMDIPYLVKNYLKKTKIYGSATMTAILNERGIVCGVNDTAQAISVNKMAEDNVWIYIPNSNIRILPILSSHAPHFLGMTFQKGHYECGDEINLHSAWDWKMGNVYAYLIDFMDEHDTTLFRVYYQDSANQPDGPRSGLVPTNYIEDRKIDIAILTLAGSSKVRNYPASRVENTKAELFVVGHWEDFFGTHGKEPVIARGSNETKFVSDLEEAIHEEQNQSESQSENMQWVLPLPFETIAIKR